MKKLLIFGLLATITCVGAWVEPTRTVVGRLKGDKFFAGRSTTFWREALAIDDPAQQEANYKQLLEGEADAAHRPRPLVTSSTNPL